MPSVNRIQTVNDSLPKLFTCSKKNSKLHTLAYVNKIELVEVKHTIFIHSFARETFTFILNKYNNQLYIF